MDFSSRGPGTSHDGDDDRQHAIAKGLQAVLIHLVGPFAGIAENAKRFARYFAVPPVFWLDG